MIRTPPPPRLSSTPVLTSAIAPLQVLKITLVMAKAEVVFEVGRVDTEKLNANVHELLPGFKRWEIIVACVSWISLAILALLTIAFAFCKVWSKPELLKQAGVAMPRMFIMQYLVSYTCVKLGTIFFMMQGYVPDLLGCTDDKIHYTGAITMVPDSTSKCEVCFSSEDKCPSLSSEDEHAHDSVYFSCTTSCKDLHYSGADQSLVNFVVIPLLWLPFAVYANNEVAQLIDGVWDQARRSGGTSRGSVRIGLSSTVHGYQTIAPLVHAATVACAAVTLVFISTGRHGYFVQMPPEVARADPAAKDALARTSTVVTLGVVVLNLTMLLRVLAEVRASQRSESSDVNKPPLSETRAQTQAHMQTVRAAHNQGSTSEPLLSHAAADPGGDSVTGPGMRDAPPPGMSRPASPEQSAARLGGGLPDALAIGGSE